MSTYLLADERPAPPWLITHGYQDHDAGVLKSGKEAEVFLVERVADDGSSCLLAHKRYRPRYPKKGELGGARLLEGHDLPRRRGLHRRLGAQNARSQGARAGLQVRSRARRIGVAGARVRDARQGVDGWRIVPYPVEQTEDGVLMEYIGDATGAAPRVANAHLSATRHAMRATSCSTRCARWRARTSSTATCPSTTCSGGKIGWSSSTSRRRSIRSTTLSRPTCCIATCATSRRGSSGRRLASTIEPFYVELIELLFNGPAADIWRKPVRRL